MEAWHYWIFLGIVLMILEIFTPGFLLASFGVGALVSSVLDYLGFGFKYQLVIFSIITISIFFSIRPFYKKYFLRFDDNRKTGVDALIGQKCEVTESIINSKNIGRIDIRGESWKALSENGENINVGKMVVVMKIEGVTAYVNLYDNH